MFSPRSIIPICRSCGIPPPRISRARSRFPSGYQMLDAKRIALVHAKDCTLEGHKPVWEPLGEGDIDWQGQIDALAEDHYDGFIHLETYWPGVGQCAKNLKRMVDSPLALYK